MRFLVNMRQLCNASVLALALAGSVGPAAMAQDEDYVSYISKVTFGPALETRLTGNITPQTPGYLRARTVADDSSRAFLGEEQGDILAYLLVTLVDRTLAQRGIPLGRYHIELELQDAIPTITILQKARHRRGLRNSASVGLGGAEIVGRVYDQHGDLILELNEREYEPTLDFQDDVTLWGDAKEAFIVFARRMAKELKKIDPDLQSD